MGRSWRGRSRRWTICSRSDAGMKVIGKAISRLFGSIGLVGFIGSIGLAGSIGFFALPGFARAVAAQGVPIGAGPGPGIGPGAGQGQSYSIDQTRYFASPEIEAAERKQRLESAAAFPAVAPVG